MKSAWLAYGNTPSAAAPLTAPAQDSRKSRVSPGAALPERAKPLEPVLDALPMGYRPVGFCAIGILRELADLIANLDRAFAEEAYGAYLGVVATEWAEL